MKATTRRGAGAAAKTRKKKGVGGGFICGCGGSKSVSIAVSRAGAVDAFPVKTPPPTKASSTATAPSTKASSTATAPSSAKSLVSGVERADAAEGTPSVDALLRQLRELERGVRALGVRVDRERDYQEESGVVDRRGEQACCSRPRHRRSASDRGAGGRGRLEEESVAVVKESADPLGDFRRSMAQMVVENEITGGAELRELLQRFLSLNSARHHHLILLAFADVWEELFSGAGDRPVSEETSLPYSTLDRSS